MEEKRSIWKETFNYGMILGLVSIVYSVLTYMLDLTFKPWIMWPSLLVSLVAMYLLLRSYRDHYNNGFISYGKALGAGVVMNIYAAILAAVYIYILYSFIDPGLVDKQLLVAEEKMIEKGVPEGAMEAGLEMSAKFMKPWITAVSTLFISIFFGFILSLIVSLTVMKQGNPLLEEAEVKE